jgi:hypothetical protein
MIIINITQKSHREDIYTYFLIPDYITLEMKPNVAWQTTVGYWVPNNS